MRVLVTGGAGYIGSAVAEELLNGGHEVVVYDNLAKGHRDAVPPGATFVHGDLGDGATAARDAAQQPRRSGRPHGGRFAGRRVDREPGQVLREQRGQRARAARRDARPRRSTGSSSRPPSPCTASRARLPIEESDPTDPINPYGETKLAFERALRWYDEAYGLHSVSLRYFNAAGATERAGERHDPETHLIPLVLQVASGTRPAISVFGDDYDTRDGTCIRDYIHVIDLARAHVLALGACDADSRAYNLGCGGDGTTVLEVIAAARAVTGHAIPTQVGARRPGDPARLVASSARIERDLGWRPTLADIRGIVESAWRFAKSRR